MSSVFIWDGWFCFGSGNQFNGYLANVILVMMDGSRDISGSGEEAGFLCVI